MKSTILVIIMLITIAQGLYFYLEHGKPFCMVERHTDTLPIVMKYRNYDLYLYKPDYDDGNEINAEMWVVSPSGKVFMKTVAKDSGKLIFTPSEPGMYTICVQLTQSLPEEFWEYGNPLRFYFEIEHGIQKMNTTKLAKIDDITQVDRTIDSLVKVLKEMTHELEYQNEKEKEIRDDDDNDNKMIVIWSCVEAVVMIIVAIAQVYSIRSYLRKKQVIE